MKSFRTRFLALVLASTMTFAIAPACFGAQSGASEKEPIEWDLSKQGKLTTSADKYYKVTGIWNGEGTGDTGIIDVPAGKTYITLANATIDASEKKMCALRLYKDSELVLTLSGTNTLMSGSGFAGMQVPVGAKLSILGKPADTLTVSTADVSSAGIGGIGNADFGTLVFEGGTISASGRSNSSAIGGGRNSKNGEIIINGGNITATHIGGESCAAIGGGTSGSVSNITISINGGKVSASAGKKAMGAAIGGNYGSSSGTIVINGGTVEAVGTEVGATIGGGFRNYLIGGEITINGGTVTATREGGAGAAIGGGCSGTGGKITINGGTVTATITGSGSATAIGSGMPGNHEKHNIHGGEIIITGGTIVAETSGSGAAIGVGNGMHVGNSGPSAGSHGIIRISGGDITATSAGGAGIGGGQFCGKVDDEGHTGLLSITGGTIKATGGANAAGIGGGNFGSGIDRIEITGGDVTASSIGSGGGPLPENNPNFAVKGAMPKTGGEVKITGGKVTITDLKAEKMTKKPKYFAPNDAEVATPTLVTVQVVEGEKPLAKATVTVKGADTYKLETSENGWVSFFMASRDNVEFTISKDGYKTETKTLNVSGDASSLGTVQMKK